MDKLSSFQGNNTLKLFHLAKELYKTTFFQTLLTDFQFKVISYILTQDNFKLWTNFIDGNCTLKIDRSGVVACGEEDDDEEEAFEEGDEPLNGLALHIRYLLWEKAIDFYYSCKDLDNSVNDIEEVSDDYELIDRIDREGDEEVVEKDEKEEAERVKEMKVRTEEDDYDDDDEDDDDDANEMAAIEDNGTGSGSGSGDSGSLDALELNEKNQVILTIPLSTLKAATKAPEGNTSNGSIANSTSSSSAAAAGAGTGAGAEVSTTVPGSSSGSSGGAGTSGTSGTGTGSSTGSGSSGTSGSNSGSDILLIREINKVYHNFEYDRETLIKRRKLEKSDKQLEENSEGDRTTGGPNGNDNSNGSAGSGGPTGSTGSASAGSASGSTPGGKDLGINLGSASHSLKHLLKTIHSQRDDIELNDFELRSLFMDVRKNRGKWSNDDRVGQEELYEACEKVVMDLRGYTEHSTPFLNKVSKREAPNYGLIIKKPMDLNTVMKKLKGFQYNSKQQFVDDLMLIWLNCLSYNADPKHFLRAHAIAMQKRTNKLIPAIPDVTIRSRAEVEKEEEMEEAAAAAAANNSTTSTIPDGKTSSSTTTSSEGGGKTSKKGRKRNKEEDIKKEVDDDEIKEIVKEDEDSNTVNVKEEGEGEKVEQGVEDIGDVEMEDASIVAEDEDDEDEDDVNVPDLDDEDVDLDIQAWRSMTAKSRADYCSKRSELFTENFQLNPDSEAMIREPGDLNYFRAYLANDHLVQKNSSNLLDYDNEPYLVEYDVMGGLPGLKYAGVDAETELKREQKLVELYLQQLGGDANNIKSNFVLPVDSGLNKVYHEIIGKIQEIRKICFKISLIRQMQTQQFVHHTQMKQPEVDNIKEVDIDPVSKLSNHDPFTSEVQYSVLRRAVSKVAMQTGFELTESFAINSLTQVTEKYISNLVKTMKTHMETSSTNKMLNKEALLATLLENGVNKPDDLYTFVQERIIKQHDKLKDLKIKLSNFLKELLRPGLENFNEKSFDDNSEQFMTGDFSSDLGDDFFGFKELGLDKEFKMLSGAIPIYLLHSRLHNNYISTGSVNKKNKYEDLKEMKDSKLLASDITRQIGILQPFYNKLLEKTKTYYIKNQKKKGELTELPPDDQFFLIEDEELPQKQKNIRPRLPPSGKIVSVKKRMIANAYFLPDDEAI